MKNILWWGLELLLSCLLIMNEKNRCSSVHREQTNCTWLNQMVDWTGTGRSYFMQVHKWRVFHVTEHQEALSFTYLDYWPDFKGTQEPIKKKKKSEIKAYKPEWTDGTDALWLCELQLRLCDELSKILALNQVQVHWDLLKRVQHVYSN